MSLKVSVFGTGYVGLVTGVCFAEKGHHVIGADIDALKIENLKKGISPIYEPGLEDLLVANYKAQRIEFTTDVIHSVSQSDILMIAVGTPPNEDGSADLKYVLTVAQTIAQHMDSYKVIVTKSTVPVGTQRKVKEAIAAELKRRKKEIEFDVVSNPEFLREGCAIEDCLKPHRVIVGLDTERASQIMYRLYEPFLSAGCPYLTMDPLSSEMSKYAANSMLAARISLMNEFAKLCEKVGANIENVRASLGSDPRIGPLFIQPGIGYGGSCFPKDVTALIHTGTENDEDLQILKAVEKTNLQQRERFFNSVKTFFNGNLKNRTIAVWGLAFKPGTDDIREAPAIYLVEKLLAAGATVIAYDPIAERNTRLHFGENANLDYSATPYEALQGAEALCIVTEWLALREPDFRRMREMMETPIVFDGRNLYSPELMSKLGFRYQSIGRQSVEAQKISAQNLESSDFVKA